MEYSIIIQLMKLTSIVNKILSLLAKLEVQSQDSFKRIQKQLTKREEWRRQEFSVRKADQRRRLMVMEVD
jgi:hypothetical protein